MRDLYIAGPMTGVENFNYDAFNKAAAFLRSLDFTVYNPAENFGGDQSLRWQTYLRLAVKQVADSYALVLLPGWKTSKGARLEHFIAQELGLPINLLEDYNGGA